jgi:hypothetical protein
MTRAFLASGFACALAVAAPLAAQDPQQPPTQTPPSSASTAQAATVSMDGCLMRELDVPGRPAPEAVRSRTNSDDDYILIDAKPSPASQGATTSAKTPQPDTPVGTSGSLTGSPAMYKVKGIDHAQLVEHKGQRVRIQGTFDRTDRTNNPETFAGDLVLLRGTAIQKIAGECPAKANDKN